MVNDKTPGGCILAGTYAISGGLGGLGKASALSILQWGGDVLLTGRRRTDEVEGDLVGLADAAQCDRGRIAYQQLDRVDVGLLTKVFAGHPLRGAVLGAATLRNGSVLELSPADVTEVLSVNAIDSFFFAQVAARRILELGTRGSIVAMSSIASSRPQQANMPYGASKAALEAMIKYMAFELAPHEIRANNLLIGTADSGLAAQVMAAQPEYAERIRAAMPMRRLGTPEEVGRAVAWLLSDQSSYVTGADIAIDGASSLAPSY